MTYLTRISSKKLYTAKCTLNTSLLLEYKHRPNSGGKYHNQEAQNKQSYSSGSKSNVGPKEVCNKCKLGGHKEKDCRTRCRYCKTVGHSTRNCRKIADKNKQQSSNMMVNAAQDGGGETWEMNNLCIVMRCNNL